MVIEKTLDEVKFFTITDDSSNEVAYIAAQNKGCMIRFAISLDSNKALEDLLDFSVYRNGYKKNLKISSICSLFKRFGINHQFSEDLDKFNQPQLMEFWDGL